MHTSMNERASPKQSTSPTNSYESACRLSTGRLSQQHRERTHAQAPTAASAVLHTLMPCQRQNVTAPRPTAQSYAERLTQNAHPALKQEPPYATARRFSSPGQQDTAHMPLFARAGSVQSPSSRKNNAHFCGEEAFLTGVMTRRQDKNTSYRIQTTVTASSYGVVSRRLSHP